MAFSDDAALQAAAVIIASGKHTPNLRGTPLPVSSETDIVPVLVGLAKRIQDQYTKTYI